MPNLIDIVEIAESFENKAVFIAESRCVVVRNRNARCRKCVQACPSDAFTIEGNTITLDSGTCVSCGACTVVCPTEALIPLRPFDEELAHAIADACVHNEGTAVFACARIASKQLADPDDFAEVPCLARLEESILTELVAQGIGKVLLIDGVCATCKYHACDKGITATVASTNTLLAAMGNPVRVERRSTFPDEMLAKDTEGLYGVSRRGFFTQARGTAKDAAEKTVVTVLKSRKDEKVASLRERLGVSNGGKLPQFEAKRRMHILDAMERFGTPQVEEIETRLWGNVTIDESLCNACNMCALFCPTGALKKLEPEEDDVSEVSGESKNALEFSMADCVQCRTCEDICIKHCLTVGSVISLDELFDFEPRVIPLPEPPKRSALVSRLNR